jgi:hypothetical protein
LDGDHTAFGLSIETAAALRRSMFSLDRLRVAHTLYTLPEALTHASDEIAALAVEWALNGSAGSGWNALKQRRDVYV